MNLPLVLLGVGLVGYAGYLVAGPIAVPFALLLALLAIFEHSQDDDDLDGDDSTPAE